VHRSAKLSQEQLACLGSGAELLNHLVTIKAKEINVRERMMELALKVAQSERVPRKLHLVPVSKIQLEGCNAPVALASSSVALTRQALSIPMLHGSAEDQQMEEAVIMMNAVQTVGLSDVHGSVMRQVCSGRSRTNSALVKHVDVCGQIINNYD
jgi:hypothetical protein